MKNIIILALRTVGASKRNIDKGFICTLLVLFIFTVLFTSCDPQLIPCCPDYVYYDETAHTENAFEQMCLNAMTHDKRYDLNYDCKLNEVDKYVDAAITCCAPLKTEITTSFLNDVISDPADWTSNDTQLLLPILDKIFSSRASDKYVSSEIYSYDPYIDSKNMIWGGGTAGYNPDKIKDLADHNHEYHSYQYRLPMNAYTWCLLNTDPKTYKCDLYSAVEFEKSLQACCSDKDTSCISSYIKNNGKCSGIAKGE